jgi:hypothetical protein
VQEQERKSRPAGHKRVATQGLLVVILLVNLLLIKLFMVLIDVLSSCEKQDITLVKLKDVIEFSGGCS